MNQLEIWLAVLAPVCCCLFASRGILHYFQLESYQFPGYFRTLKRNPVHSLLPGVCSSVAMVALLYLFDLVAVRGASAFWRIAAMILLLPVSGFASGFSLGRRQGLCPLYPLACAGCMLLFLPLARLISNMADGVLVPIALCAALLGNLAGAALRRYRRG